jgi:23S rRNA-/tRNA-specific pseudouridylate synthase
MYASLDINRLMYLDSFFYNVKQYFLNMFLNSTYKKTNKPLMEQGISRSALTECEKVLDLPEARCSLLKVVIKTGRWHQIRKHLNHRAYHVCSTSQQQNSSCILFT